MGRLRVGGCCRGCHDTLDRAKALVKAGVDVLVVDTATDIIRRCSDMVTVLKQNLPE